MNESLAFFLQMSINDMQYLIWRVPLHEIDNVEFVVKHRVCWSFTLSASLEELLQNCKRPKKLMLGQFEHTLETYEMILISAI